MNFQLISVDFLYNLLLYISMLEFAAVLTTGGLLLFCNSDVDRNIFLTLVNQIIDSKNLQSQFIIDTLKFNFLYDAVLGLVYLISWRKQITLDHPKKLLQLMSLSFKNAYEKIIWKDNLIVDAPDFKKSWEIAFQNWQNYVKRKDEEGTIMKNFHETAAGKKVKKQQKQKDETKEQSTNQDTSQNQQKQAQQEEEDPQFAKLSPRERLLLKRKSQSPKTTKNTKKSPQAKQQQSKKESRQWEGGKITKKQLQMLDKSKNSNIKSSQNKNKYLEEQNLTDLGFIDSDQQEKEQSKFLSRWVGKLKNVVGDKTITRDDLKEVLADFKQKLMEKNVAHDVAEHVAQAVGSTLLQTKTKSFTTVHKTVKDAMKQALRKILTPKRKIDLVVEVTKQREKMKPYVIVFIGVNGVGKSTNLAKVAYKLKTAKLSVMLAACDNFRAGAVEQIQTHGRNLDIPVYQKGYKQEPANIAFQAIRDATKKRIDAVLVDTAGRMQDNQPLMKELARLVKLNKPNLVVFIGEALVGNDAVDQITKFNKAIKQQSTDGYLHEIDAILLSKFDTVDDKVGTALSLVYTTSKPILYVGVGQKYPNLKELNVSTVVQALLS